MPTNEPRATKNERRDAARQKAQALREQQERARKRNQIIGIAVLSLAVAGLGYGIFVMAQQARETAAEAAAMATAVALSSPTAIPSVDEVVLPSTADPVTGGIPVSKGGVGVAAEGGVTVDVYLDPICPFCGVFEQANGADLIALAKQSGITIVYHPLAIMDEASLGTHYSVRAANALGVVADMDPNHFSAFQNALFAEDVQPEEGTKGLNDREIAEIAQSVGVTEAVTEHFTDTVEFQGHTVRKYVPWLWSSYGLAPLNEQFDPPSVGTPTILINGEWYMGDFQNRGPLKAAIEEALQVATTSVETPTAEPSPATTS